MLPNSQARNNSHPPSKESMFPVLYNELDNSIGRVHTFPNFLNYYEFSFSLKGGNVTPQDIIV